MLEHLVSAFRHGEPQSRRWVGLQPMGWARLVREARAFVMTRCRPAPAAGRDILALCSGLCRQPTVEPSFQFVKCTPTAQVE